MLSESKIMDKLEERKRLRTLPETERPVTVRLKFRKVGSLQYISHLDLQRTMMRILIRACIPTWYTKGFNPHAKLVFSTPLSIGVQSEYEFLDVRIDREMSCEEIMRRMNLEMTDELCITDVYLPEHEFSEIAWASYEIEIFSPEADASQAEDIRRFLTTSPVYLTKKTKSGEKEIDIVPMIHSLDLRFDSESGTFKISTVLRATSAEFLNPDLLVTAIKRQFGLLSGASASEWYTIVKTSLLNENFELFR